jgi:hypothetical protein
MIISDSEKFVSTAFRELGIRWYPNTYFRIIKQMFI